MQTKKVTRPTSTYTSEEPPRSHEADLTDIDDFLDEVDRILEEHTVAHEYLQKGGE